MNRGNNQSMLDEVYEEMVKMHADGWSGKEEMSFKGNILRGQPWFTKVVLEVLYSMYIWPRNRHPLDQLAQTNWGHPVHVQTRPR